MFGKERSTDAALSALGPTLGKYEASDRDPLFSVMDSNSLNPIVALPIAPSL
jgi:hypothetical protein